MTMQLPLLRRKSSEMMITTMILTSIQPVHCKIKVQQCIAIRPNNETDLVDTTCLKHNDDPSLFDTEYFLI